MSNRNEHPTDRNAAEMSNKPTKADLARRVEILEASNAELKDQLKQKHELLEMAINGLLEWNGLPKLKQRETQAELQVAECS